ncbi:helix-turn-helix domain-containing protein [Antarcticirhabdus aurantiaca]|uniref:Helix-turn-helix transcriptional regulator n=2 Tax=Antarcticirhabdus aurantiaca TaxID=2606717 RepID=A0ACD4NSA9_9HYPH|nr:helix-turn-helix transcriptional regulator [Jeongeuplla avenae]
MPKDPIDIHIGSRLRSLRERRHLSLSAVGRGVGTTYQQVRKYESGDNRISASTLFRLADMMEVSPSFFFEGLPRRAAQDANGAALDAGDAAMTSSLEQIADPELRHHLEGLLNALTVRSASR